MKKSIGMLVCAIALAHSAGAENYEYKEGLLDAASSWNPEGIPGASDTVILGNSDYADTMTVSSSYG